MLGPLAAHLVVRQLFEVVGRHASGVLDEDLVAESSNRLEELLSLGNGLDQVEARGDAGDVVLRTLNLNLVQLVLRHRDRSDVAPGGDYRA